MVGKVGQRAAGQGQERRLGGGAYGGWVNLVDLRPLKLLTSLALHLQANVDSFIDKINDPPEVILTELTRSQCWGPLGESRRRTINIAKIQTTPVWELFPSSDPRSHQASSLPE